MKLTDTYTPSKTILEKYADVLVNFALGNDEGISPGDVVQCVVPDVAKPLCLELQNAILKSGGHPMIRLLPTGFDKHFFDLASPEQLAFFPKKYHKARTDLVDHQIAIIADVDPFELADIDPAKIITARDTKKQIREWFEVKENKGKFTWTIALWGVQAKADVVGLTLEQYWDQIIDACFLDKEDPINEWRKIKRMQRDIRDNLNALEISYLHIKGDDVDLKIELGPERIWKGGADRNIPSFELFTSPNWRGTEGWIRFNQPVYRYGNILSDVRLEFKKGIVTKASAKKGEKLLQQMLKSKNANKVGEFSLTDSRFSRITHLMAETLYDENIGGSFGNTHIAIGSAYKDCYRGDVSKVSKAQWQKMGYNESPEHTDIVSTTDRTVTATLTDGTEKLIYKDGKFVV
ncbi:MAG: aminopeptidase [Patescibacteria group bacterium]|nr:aminopeptidase [Patescibacteria group bacterium]